MIKSLENRSELTNLDRGVAFGIAGFAMAIGATMCAIPLGRTISPGADGERIFEIVYTKLLNIFEGSRTSGRKNLVE